MNTQTDSTAQGQIQFIQNHQTALGAGKYQIKFEQTVKGTDYKNNNFSASFDSSFTFIVQGSRFELNPQDIHSVFPPAGSSGDHSHVLPHIVLKRSTLPWERLAQSGNQYVPWLALIVIYEEEENLLKTILKENIDKISTKLWEHLLSKNIAWLKSINDNEAIILDKKNRKTEKLQGDFAKFEEQVEAILAQVKNTKVITLKSLKQSYTKTIKWNAITLEIGQHEDDNVSVIDINKKFLSEILPTTKNLEYLAHVRQVTGDEENNEPLAVIISNRIPKKNGRSTAYLVSFEELFNEKGEFNYQNANDTDYIRLVTLKTWSFSCIEPEHNFKGLLKNLNKNTLNLPKLNNQEADKYLAKGYIPLPHYLRQGGKTYSWYHSPLLPGENPTALQLSQLSIRCADQLIAYDSTNGLFDISYAAAWQLGQLLALQDKKFAVSLFNWKRTNAQNLAKDNQQALYPHLFAKNKENRDNNSEFPKDVKTWLERLGLLYNIPFNYLVPDETMLPIESIRFFCLDWFWVESLLDGAFSIGGVQESNVQEKPIAGEAKVITGFLMRSEVVSGWPDLQIDGSSSLINDDSSMEVKLDVLRCDRLSEDVLICLFDGEIKTVDISLKPEGLHFGFNFNEKTGTLSRELRQLDGTERSDLKIEEIDAIKKVINISELADKFQRKLEQEEGKEKVPSFTSAEFALQMVQGAEKVRFKLIE
ncbi:hypothetical protein [Microcoleus sp. Pol12B5]|uniref:hypothetical protein n=1 Tax=Microcoleus sp. Pol12B5 TaxID=3055396 RepID=UPI002FD04AB7